MQIKSLTFFSLVALMAATLISCVIGDEDVVNTDKYAFVLPNPLSDEPLIESTYKDGGRFFSFHIPLAYDMQLLFRGSFTSLGNSKQSITVLSGLFEFYRNKVKTDDGQLRGPLRAKMFGLTLYDNKDHEY